MRSSYPADPGPDVHVVCSRLLMALVLGFACAACTPEPAPLHITSITPLPAQQGKRVSVIGTGFGQYVPGESGVLLSAACAPILSWSDTLIEVQVPAGIGVGERLLGLYTADHAYVTAGVTITGPNLAAPADALCTFAPHYVVPAGGAPDTLAPPLEHDIVRVDTSPQDVPDTRPWDTRPLDVPPVDTTILDVPLPDMPPVDTSRPDLPPDPCDRCTTTEACCADRCIPNTSLRWDNQNCGGCGVVCSTNKVCADGACVTPQSLCHGMDLDIATEPCDFAAGESCHLLEGPFYGGDQIVLKASVWGGQADPYVFPAGSYDEVEVRVATCIPQWASQSASDEHGVVWLSHSGDPNQTMVDVTLSPCVDASCGAWMTAHTLWSNSTSSTRRETSVSAGGTYRFDVVWQAYVVQSTVRQSNGTPLGDLVMSTNKGPVEFWTGTSLNIILGYQDWDGSRPALPDWRFSNVWVRMRPFIGP